MERMARFRARLGARPFIAMVHVGALPGTPKASDRLETVIERAVAEASIYRDEGCAAIGLENMHDRPYVKSAAGPEIVAAMTAVARDVKRATALPIGIQILAGANREALAVAHAVGADFVRVEGFVFAHVADEGLMDGSAGDLLRYRRAIGAEDVLIFADVKKKHAAHAITADLSIAGTARAAEFFLADGVIVTGAVTGAEASPDELQAVVDAVNVPVLVGSGLTPDNLHRFRSAHGFIVGSSLKEGGAWDRPVDRAAVRRFVQACADLA